MNKTCSKCDKEYPATKEYFSVSTNSKTGFQSWCRECCNTLTKSRRKNNKEKCKRQARKSHLKLAFGISVEDYNRMFEEQKGLCAICSKHQIEFNRRFDVDHDHKTKEVRGLLCGNCNKILGLSHEDISILNNAICYLY